jgi:hypothetical protein
MRWWESATHRLRAACQRALGQVSWRDGLQLAQAVARRQGAALFEARAAADLERS